MHRPTQTRKKLTLSFCMQAMDQFADTQLNFYLGLHCSLTHTICIIVHVYDIKKYNIEIDDIHSFF